jgi:single stranded DNA-binding protein
MLNKVTLIGWVGQPPEVTQPGSRERKLAKISLSTKRRWTSLDGEAREETTWHTVEGWEGSAEILAQVSKGDLLYIDGYIKNEVHEGKFHSAIVAQKVLRLKTADQGRVTRRASLEDLVRSLDAHDAEVLGKLLAAKHKAESRG